MNSVLLNVEETTPVETVFSVGGSLKDFIFNFLNSMLANKDEQILLSDFDNVISFIRENEKTFDLKLSLSQSAYVDDFALLYYEHEKEICGKCLLQKRKNDVLFLINKINELFFQTNGLENKKIFNSSLAHFLLFKALLNRIDEEKNTLPKKFLVENLNLFKDEKLLNFAVYTAQKIHFDITDILPLLERLDYATLTNVLNKTVFSEQRKSIKNFNDKIKEKYAPFLLLSIAQLEALMQKNQSLSSVFKNIKDRLMEKDGYYHLTFDADTLYYEIFNYENNNGLYVDFIEKSSPHNQSNALLKGVSNHFGKAGANTQRLLDVFNVKVKNITPSFHFSGQFLDDTTIINVFKNILVYPFVESFLSEKEQIAFLTTHKLVIQKAFMLFFFEKFKQNKKTFIKNLTSLLEEDYDFDNYDTLISKEKRTISKMEQSILSMYFRCRFLNLIPPTISDAEQIAYRAKYLGVDEPCTGEDFFKMLIVDNVKITEIVRSEKINQFEIFDIGNKYVYSFLHSTNNDLLALSIALSKLNIKGYYNKLSEYRLAIQTIYNYLLAHSAQNDSFRETLKTCLFFTEHGVGVNFLNKHKVSKKQIEQKFKNQAPLTEEEKLYFIFSYIKKEEFAYKILSGNF